LRFDWPIICAFGSRNRRRKSPRRCLLLSLAVACAVGVAGAQTPGDLLTGREPSRDTTVDSLPRPLFTHHLIVLLAGGFTSLALHESGHILASYAVGAHPSFGFNKGRPTIYSGINATTNPQKQFIFSSMGLTVQTLLDEAIIDIPHSRSSTFERGILLGGLTTTAFYITLGRNGSVSDVEYMARTSSLSKWGVSAIYGGIAATQVIRMSFMGRYVDFFAEPQPPNARAKYGAFDIGVRFKPRA
jgi:hypothetical protein